MQSTQPLDPIFDTKKRTGAIVIGNSPPPPPDPPVSGDVVATPIGTISGITNTLTTGVLNISAGDTVFVIVNAKTGNSIAPSAPVVTGLSATWTSVNGTNSPQYTQDPGSPLSSMAVYSDVLDVSQAGLVVYAAYFAAPVSGTITASWTVSVAGASIMNVVTITNLAPDLSSWVNATFKVGRGLSAVSPLLTPVFTDDRSPCLMIAASRNVVTSAWTAGYTEIFDNADNASLAAALAETGIADPTVTFSAVQTGCALIMQLKKAVDPSAIRLTSAIAGSPVTSSAGASSVVLAGFPVLAAGDHLLLFAFSITTSILNIGANTTGLTFTEVQRTSGITGASSTGVRMYISNAVTGPVTGSVTIANGNSARGMWVIGVGLRDISTRFDCQKQLLIDNTPGTSFNVPEITTQAVDALDLVLAFVEDDNGAGASTISSSLAGFTNILAYGSTTGQDISINIWAETRATTGVQATPAVAIGTSQECCIVRLVLEAAYA